MRSELEKMSLGELIVMLNPDFTIGATHYPTPVSEDGEFLKNPKRWMIQHNLYLIFTANDPEDKVDEWETLGFDIEHVKQADISPIYGNTPKECLINFFIMHPELILTNSI